MKAIDKIRNSNPQLADKIENHCWFISDIEVPELIKIDRLIMVMVRCGGGRFLCPIQDLNHFIKIIEEHNRFSAKYWQTNGDYVRDVSLPID